MAHLHLIEDNQGDVVDHKVYCCDYCNRADNPKGYQGWNGCNEISVTQPCEHCESEVQGLDEYGDE